MGDPDLDLDGDTSCLTDDTSGLDASGLALLAGVASPAMMRERGRRGKRGGREGSKS